MDTEWKLPVTSTVHKTGAEDIFDRFYKEFPTTQAISTAEQQSVATEVRRLTYQIFNHNPYGPLTWLKRSSGLLQLGYPDLAAGDAYKAWLLLRSLDSSDERLKSTVTSDLALQVFLTKDSSIDPFDDHDQQILAFQQSLNRQTILAIGQALFCANCFIECVEFVKQNCSDIEQDEELRILTSLASQAQTAEDAGSELQSSKNESDLEGQEDRRSGTIISRVYPWMHPGYTRRSSKVVNLAREEVKFTSKGRCTLKHSQICDEVSPMTSSMKDFDVLGLFAESDLVRKEVIFVDSTLMSGIDDERERCDSCRGQPESFVSRCGICKAPVCSNTCRDLAIQYHDTHVCKESLEHIDHCPATRTRSADTMAYDSILYRALKYAKVQKASHPLHTDMLGRMTPSLIGDQICWFSFENDIVEPICMLKGLGVNIFSDQSFDTWVIQAIQARIRNNCREDVDSRGAFHLSVNPKYIFLNHSCSPNVAAEVDDEDLGSSTLRISARRAIRAGEELFVSYVDDDDLERSYEERQELLQGWTGGVCQCQRCSAERAIMQATSPALEQEKEGQDDDEEDVVTWSPGLKRQQCRGGR